MNAAPQFGTEETYLVCGECAVHWRARGASFDPSLTSIGQRPCEVHPTACAPTATNAITMPSLWLGSRTALPSGDPTIDAYTGVEPPAPWAQPPPYETPRMSETEIVTRLMCAWTTEEKG